MKENEAIITGSLTVLMVILWLGFLTHQSSIFAGSLVGGLFAVAGSLLMLIPLIYVPIKRVSFIKKRVTKYISMRTLLTIHIYAGIIGPILVLIHTGHKFNSSLGIALTSMTLIIVISGYIGRYFLKIISRETHEKEELLKQANLNYADITQEIQLSKDFDPNFSIFERVGFFMSSLFLSPAVEVQNGVSLKIKALRLSETIADLEYAIKSHQQFKKLFSTWKKVHISLSFVLYLLLAAHIWSAIHFGLRWFR